MSNYLSLKLAERRPDDKQVNPAAVTFVLYLAVFIATLDMFVVTVALGVIGDQMGHVPLGGSDLHLKWCAVGQPILWRNARYERPDDGARLPTPSFAFALLAAGTLAFVAVLLVGRRSVILGRRLAFDVVRRSAFTI